MNTKIHRGKTDSGPHLCDHRVLAHFWMTITIPCFALMFGFVSSASAEVTLRGSLVCNGATIPEPKAVDHVMALFAIDGTDKVRAEVDRIVREYFPDQGLDAEAAQKLMDQFSARLKYYIAPDSPALKDAK